MIVTKKDTAVVILSYNSTKWLDMFLPKIIEQAESGYEVVVVDHASTDGTLDFLARRFPEVHALRLEENHGFAWGYAQGLERIKAKYYVLLSADFEVTDQWFPPLHKAMEGNLHMAACQPKVRYFKDRNYFEYAGAAGGYMDAWGYLFCRGRMFDKLERDEGQYDDAREVFWASGGCFVVRSEAYHAIGGLDPDLVSHMEEVDLCWRLKNAGHAIGYVPESVVFHVGGSVITYGSPQKTFYNFRNNLLLLLKNEAGGKLFWLLPFRLTLDGIAGLQFLAQGKPANTMAIIRAHFSFYACSGKWWKKRKAAKALWTDRKNKNGLYKKSVLVQFFFKGRKKFSDLSPRDFVS